MKGMIVFIENRWQIQYENGPDKEALIPMHSQSVSKMNPLYPGTEVEFDIIGVNSMGRDISFSDVNINRSSVTYVAKVKATLASESEVIANVNWEEELKKCKASPYYFAKHYCLVEGQPFTTPLSEEQFNEVFNALGTNYKLRR